MNADNRLLVLATRMKAIQARMDEMDVEAVDYGDELRKRYASQLTIYREALATLTGEPVKETYIYSFRLREAVPIK